MWFIKTFVLEVLGVYETQESINIAISNNEMMYWV